MKGKGGPLPDAQTLRQSLRYEPETGKLFWIERPRDHFVDVAAWRRWNATYVGAPAFCMVRKRGERTGRFFKKRYQAHRIIWVLVYGEEPYEIDHIDGNPGNNQLSNLRNVSTAENCRNRPLPRHNTSGVVGVRWDKARKLWNASIRTNGKSHSLGYFACKDDAIAAREKAAREMGFHPNHGRLARV